MRRVRWEPSNRKVPKRPYRDSAILYGMLAALVAIISVATGGDVVRALIFAGAAFVLATGFSWWRWRTRLRRQEEEQ